MSNLSKKASNMLSSVASFSGLGLLMSTQESKSTENFENINLSAGQIVLIVIAILFSLILIPVASYKLMGNSVGHAVLALLFGVFYIILAWLWCGLFTKYTIKL